MIFFYQIHFLRSILRRPHTDRIPEGVPKKVRRNRKRDSCEIVPQEGGLICQSHAAESANGTAMVVVFG